MYSMRKSRPLEHNTPRRRAQRQRAHARVLRKFTCWRLTTVTPPPTRAPRAPFASTTRAPSVAHGSVGSMGASGGARCLLPRGSPLAASRDEEVRAEGLPTQ